MKSNLFRGDLGSVVACLVFGGALCAVLFLVVPGRASAQQTSFAGWLLNVNCNAQIRESSKDPPKRVNLKPGQRRPLVVGESVQCQSGNSLTIQAVDGSQTVYPDKWVDIKPSASALDSKSKSNTLTNAFAPAFTRGASPSKTIFYSPPPDGTVDPEHLILRWELHKWSGNVTISVKPENSDDLLCCEGSFPASSGSLDSTGLRAAITKYRDRGARDPLELSMRVASGQEYKASFAVLTLPDKRKLQKELEEWDGKDELVRHLGRASVFGNFDLFTEAASEYEAALKQSPGSVMLLEPTLAAELRTGNLPRASELEGELKQMSAKVQ
jgi:hypothetical protein